MKKVIFILALMVSTGTIYAQQPDAKIQGQNNRKYVNIDSKAEAITNKLKTDLTLTDDQTSQVQAITLNRVKQVHDAKASNQGNPAGFNKARKTIFETWETELKGIVTDDQYAKYLQIKADRKKEKAAKKVGAQEDVEDMFTK